MNPCPGEVWQVNLGLAGKVRPVIIVSRDDPDAPRVLWIYVPITSQNRGSKYEVELPRVSFLTAGSTANVQAVGSGLRDDFLRKLGKLTPDILQQVRDALAYAVGLV
jgi:mRNA interferase MazF